MHFVSSFTPRRLRWRALALTLTVATAALAAPQVRSLEETDQFSIEPRDDAAVVQIALATPPANAGGTAQLQARSRDLIHWSVPLEGAPGQWSASLEPGHLQALLFGESLEVAIAGAANSEGLRITIPRERFLPALETADRLVQNDPLFFALPDPPPAVEVPAADVSRGRAETFAAQARQRDRELVRHQHEFAAARSRAHSLFLDLRTAGRLPWQGEALERIAENYATLQQQEAEIAQSRDQWRASAAQFVQAWNQSHPGQPPLQLNFDEATTRVAEERPEPAEPPKAATAAE